MKIKLITILLVSTTLHANAFTDSQLKWADCMWELAIETGMTSDIDDVASYSVGQMLRNRAQSMRVYDFLLKDTTAVCGELEDEKNLSFEAKKDLVALRDPR